MWKPNILRSLGRCPTNSGLGFPASCTRASRRSSPTRCMSRIRGRSLGSMSLIVRMCALGTTTRCWAARGFLDSNATICGGGHRSIGSPVIQYQAQISSSLAEQRARRLPLSTPASAACASSLSPSAMLRRRRMRFIYTRLNVHCSAHARTLSPCAAPARPRGGDAAHAHRSHTGRICTTSSWRSLRKTLSASLPCPCTDVSAGAAVGLQNDQGRPLAARSASPSAAAARANARGARAHASPETGHRRHGCRRYHSAHAL